MASSWACELAASSWALWGAHHRPVPDDGLAWGELLLDELGGARPVVDAEVVGGDRVHRHGHRLRPRVEGVRGDDVMWQDHLDTLGLGHRLELGRQLELVLLDERLAHLEAARLEEGERHSAAHHQQVHLLHQRLQHRDLARDLCPSDDRRKGALGLRHGAVQVVELLLEQDAGHGMLHVGHHARRRRMRAVSRPERVVDEDGCAA